MRKKSYQAEYTDLRLITRASDQVRTLVILEDRYRENTMKWLEFGECRLRRSDSSEFVEYALHAFLPRGVTDFEHDSACAVSLPLIGLEFRGIEYHQATFTAFISLDAGEPFAGFHVPRPGYNPMEHEDAEMCDSKHCNEPHIIVPEDFYVPSFDSELYAAVRGRGVRIYIGPVLEEDDA